jgi:nicotinamide phosphoribosyltransferase
MIRKFGHFPFYAVVSDTYNIYEAVERDWGERLHDDVLAASGTLVVRPDSGVPQEVVRQVTEILARKFGYTTNDKGYKVLNKVRIIQGDGVDYDEVGRILEALKIRGWSADNVSFGMGGALLQRLDRDTQKFALKASEHTTAGRTIEIFKSPVGDNTKRSKPGRLKLVRTDSGLETYNVSDPSPAAQGADLLQLVYENGFLHNVQTFSEIRERADRGLLSGGA